MTIVQPLVDGVDRGRERPGGDADGAAAEREQDRLGEELGADLPAGRAERAAQPDLRAAFQHGDDHDVRDADGAHQQGHGAESEEEAVEGALGVGARGERGGRLADVDFVGRFRVRGGGEHRLDGRDLAVLGAHVDGVGVPVELQVAFRGLEADEHRAFDFGCEHRWAEDADEVEPLVRGPDPLAGVDVVDARVARAAAEPSTATGSRAVAAFR